MKIVSPAHLWVLLGLPLIGREYFTVSGDEKSPKVKNSKVTFAKRTWDSWDSNYDSEDYDIKKQHEEKHIDDKIENAINEQLRKMNVDQSKTIARISETISNITQDVASVKKVIAEQTKAIDQNKKEISRSNIEIKDLQKTYEPNGPQVNVPREIITKGGWRVCYRGSYADVLTDSAVQDIADTMCLGSRIMMGCGKEHDVPSTMQLIAWGPRKAVFKITSDVGVVSMGTRFYRTGKVWGFTGGSTKSSEWGSVKTSPFACDDDQKEGEKRLCWHTSERNMGWRCGQDDGLHDHKWKRVIFESD